MDQLLKWLANQPQQVVTILATVIGGLLAIIAGLFTIILWPLLRSGGGKIWDKLTTFFTGRAFENRYLEWMIREHQFLPILPTTLVPVTERHNQELDKLYVSLTRTRDQHETQEITLGGVMQRSDRNIILACKAAHGEFDSHPVLHEEEWLSPAESNGPENRRR
jgi:hypothetical protein